MTLQYFYNPADQQIELVEPLKYNSNSLTVRRFLLDDHQRTFTHKEFAKVCASWISLEHRRDAFEALNEYRRDLTALMTVVNVHGDNMQVFGFKDDLQVMYTTNNNDLQIGLVIKCDALRRAIGYVAITAKGELIKYGSGMSVRGFVEQTREWSNAALRHLYEAPLYEALEGQWKAATDDLFKEAESICPPVIIETPHHNLCSSAKVIKLLEISPTTLSRYRSGKVPAGYPPFPKPDRFKGRSPMWSSRSIFTWANSKTN